MGVAGIRTAAEAVITAPAVNPGVVHHPEPTHRECLLRSRGASEPLRSEEARTPLFQKGGDVAAPDAARGRGNGARRLRGAPAGGEQVGWKGQGESGTDGRSRSPGELGGLGGHQVKS